MKEQDLINMGFKKENFDGEYWYEIVCRNHKFITNDTAFNKKKDRWHIGYEDTEIKTDIFWFNNNLTEEPVFKTMFRVLTGVEFKLAHQRKLIK